MNLRQIEIFLRLSNNLSFARTSEELFITQPTVTREIQAIESELGVQLFRRTRRSVELTAAGSVLKEDLLIPYTGISNAILKARNIQTRFQSQLRIGFCNTASVLRMPEAIRIFRERYSDMQVMVFSRNLSTLNELFSSGQLDVIFGMQSAMTPGEGDGFRRLYRGTLCAVVPVDHVLADRQILTKEDIKGHTILLQESSAIPPLMAQLHNRLRTLCPESSILNASTMDELEILLLSGIGLSIAPQYSLPPSDRYRMIPLRMELSQSMEAMDYYSLWHRDRQVRHTDEFVTIMTELYAEDRE